MVQIAFIIMAMPLFWEGAKGFGPKGIKIGLFKANSEPITGPKAKLFGSLIIGVGLVILFVALVVLPYYSGQLLFIARGFR